MKLFMFYIAAIALTRTWSFMTSAFRSARPLKIAGTTFGGNGGASRRACT